MNKFQVIKSLLMNAPVSLTMTVVAEIMNIVLGHSQHINPGSMALKFVVSFAFAFLIACFIPTEKWGFSFAKHCGAKEGSLKFDILVNLVVNTVFCVLMTLFMSWFSACIMEGLPITVVPGSFMEMIIPVWICCFFVSLLTQKHAIRLAKDICRE